MPKKIRIELDYDIGDKVFLITDPEQQERMVTTITLYPGGVAVYTLAMGDTESEHFTIEISDKKKVFD